MNPELQKIVDAIDGIQKQVADVTEKVKAGDLDADGQKAIGEQLETLTADLAAREAEKHNVERDANQKALMERLENLERQAVEGRKPHEGFIFPGQTPVPGDAKAIYGQRGAHSFYNDVRLGTTSARDQKALERLEESIEGLDKKAMVEGIEANGGFMVSPEVSNELITLREGNGVLRSLFSSTNVTSDEITFRRLDNGLAVAWTAELAEKILSEFRGSSFSARVFTAAGLAVVSNQLLADADWSVDRLINQDLARRFIWLEENGFLAGDGEGQPLGILNTPGVTPLAFKSGTQKDLIDKLQEAITLTYTEYLGAPTAMVMHPRTWAWIVSAREEGNWLVGTGSTIYGRNAIDRIPGYNGGAFPRGELLGVPVYTTPSVPTTLGGGTESAIFVGDFNQGLVLDRQGITTDRSEHVFFTSNQTVFRSEERVGFTAGRYPKAFTVVQGAGLAGH